MPTVPAEPAYRRVMSDIESRIVTGELRPGDQLPSVRELTDQHGCAQSAVKQAIGRLHERGAVLAYPGRGVYVPPMPG